MDDRINDIIKFLTNQSVFFHQLEENCQFEKQEFHKYTSNVAYVTSQELRLESKFTLANSIWETVFKIQLLLGAHLDPNDIFFIENIDEEDVYQIQKVSYYIANWFSRGELMEDRLLLIGGW